MREFRIHYDVLCLRPPRQPGPPQLLDLVRPHVRWTAFDRRTMPAAFVHPTFAAHYDGAGDHEPSDDPHGVNRSILCQLIDQAQGGFSIVSDATADDLTPLQAAWGMASVLAATSMAVVVDRTCDLGYTPDDFARMEDDLNSDGNHDVRDSVIVQRREGQRGFHIGSVGMNKFGQRDFMMLDVPPSRVNLCVSVMYDHLCQYAALQADILPNQTMQYRGTDPAACWLFSPAADGRLVVSDVELPGKRAVPGLHKFFSVVAPEAAAS